MRPAFIKPAGRGGFSLLEIMLVIFIISLVAAIVYPSISFHGSIREDAKTAASILRYLYDTALASKETCNLKVNLQEKTAFYKCLEEQREFTLSTLSSIETSTKGVVKEGELFVFFSPQQQDNVIFHLSSNGRNLSVSLNSLSGRVKTSEQ